MKKSIWAVVAGVLVIIGVTTLVDVVLHAAGVFPPMDQPIDDALALLATSYRIVISIGGAWLTARLAPRKPMKHARFSTLNWYDVWFPNLAPSGDTMKLAKQAATPAQWSKFAREYKAEMAAPAARHDLELLAAMSHTSSFSVGCYCRHEHRCHRSILKRLLVENGAKVEASRSLGGRRQGR